MTSFDSLIRDAGGLPLEGWDFAPIGHRWQRGGPSWDLPMLVRERFATSSSFLDLGTGGGEFLSSLAPLPPASFATEGYAPNVAVARRRLEPLGVRVLPIGSDLRIDLPDSSLDLVLSRHEAFDPVEVARVLRPGGVLLTQQVGGRNYFELERRFDVPSEPAYNRIGSAESFAEEISESHTLLVEDARECTFPERFLDVGAVVYFLRAAPWEVPGFTVERFRSVLEALHQEIERVGFWELTAHRLLVQARKRPD